MRRLTGKDFVQSRSLVQMLCGERALCVLELPGQVSDVSPEPKLVSFLSGLYL
jgi:hypothetical protein